MEHISSPCIVRLTWQLHDTQNELIDEISEPTEFFVGGDDLLSKVEEALQGQSVGFETTLHLEPEHAFGDYDAGLVFFESIDIFGQAVEPGMQFEGPPPGAVTEGLDPQGLYTVTEVYDSHVVLDGNHPLAGIALRLSLKVHDIREATEDELERQSVAEPTFSLLGTGQGTDPRSLH